MQRFFRSGAAFIVVALLCLAAALFSSRGVLFVSLGAFWLFMAIGVRRRYLVTPPSS